MGKKKKKLKKQVKTKRLKKKKPVPKNKYEVIVHDPKLPYLDKKFTSLEEVKIRVNGKTFYFSYVPTHNCLQIECTDKNIYLQPFNVGSFLIK